MNIWSSPRLAQEMGGAMKTWSDRVRRSITTWGVWTRPVVFPATLHDFNMGPLVRDSAALVLHSPSDIVQNMNLGLDGEAWMNIARSALPVVWVDLGGSSGGTPKDESEVLDVSLAFKNPQGGLPAEWNVPPTL